jgi:chromosome partitioning protein
VSPATSAYAFFTEARPLTELIRAQTSGIRIIPASLELSKIETLHGADAAIPRRLRDGIHRDLDPDNQLILIDCCPTLGVLTLNALIAADRVLMPVSADFLSLEAVNKLHAALSVLEQRLKKVFLRRVVITRFDARRRLSYDIQRQLRGRFHGSLCETVISENVSLAESPMHAKDIFAHAPSSQGANDYKALTAELEAGNFFN